MVDAELVNRIVDHVVAALRGAEGAASRPAPQAAARSVHPGGAKPEADPPDEDKTASPARPRPKVFVTADVLAQRLADKPGGGLVELAHNEFLTPAAADLAEERGLAVRRAPSPSPVMAGPQHEQRAVPQPDPEPQRPDNPASPGAGAIGLVTDRADPKVSSVTAALAYDGLSLVDYNQTDCWMKNLQALCGAVAGGSMPAGVAILPYAADAMVLANKIRGVRAVQGTRGQSVAAGLRRFDANILIIEHAFSSFHEMRAMVRQFATERPGQAAARTLMEAVNRIERA